MKLSKLIYAIVFIVGLSFIIIPTTQAHFSEQPTQIKSGSGVVEVYQVDRQAIQLNTMENVEITLTLVNSSGTIVFSDIITNTATYSINVSSLPSGRYSITGTIETESTTLKVDVPE